MTKNEARDLAFEKTIEYVRSIKSNISQKELSFIARVIGNYETNFRILENEITQGE